MTRFEEEVLEPELRPEYIEKIRRIEKGRTIPIKDFATHFGVKLQRKDAVAFEAIQKKIAEISENPSHYKPLHAPLQHLRRVHIYSSFVLLFRIEEHRKTIVLVDYDHHDSICRR